MRQLGFSGKGIIVTAILLNGWNDCYPELHEAVLTKTGPNYGFNVSTAEGFETHQGPVFLYGGSGIPVLTTNTDEIYQVMR